MSDDLQTDDEPVIEEDKKPARSDNRFKDLSEKVETTAKERDEAKAEADKAKKDAEFYKGFNSVSSKHQHASEYQDQIKAKVDAGYELEDAAVSVLTREGKYVTPQQESQRESPAGGSASTSIKSPDDKPVSEMTTAEKREKLEQFERENPGQLSQTLRKLTL